MRMALQEELEEEAAVPLGRMEYGHVGQSYVLLARPPGSMATGKLATTLQFTVKEIDPASGARPGHCRRKLPWSSPQPLPLSCCGCRDFSCRATSPMPVEGGLQPFCQLC